MSTSSLSPVAEDVRMMRLTVALLFAAAVSTEMVPCTAGCTRSRSGSVCCKQRRPFFSISHATASITVAIGCALRVRDSDVYMHCIADLG